MREAVILASLVAFVSARPEAGYSYNSPSAFYRASISENSGYNNFVGNSFSNGYSYNRPSNVYGFSDTGNIISNYIPPELLAMATPSLQDTSIPDQQLGNTFSGKNNELNLTDLDLNALPDVELNGMTDLELNATTKKPKKVLGNTKIGQAPPGPVPQISTSVYAFLAPKEPELLTPPKVIPPPQPKINYKIIFIKSPAPPTPSVPVIPPITQDKEKTIIYVLVKRPEEAPQITIPTVAPTAPSKPEVYFIRYKTQKKTEEVGGGRIETYDSSLSTKYGPPGYSGPY